MNQEMKEQLTQFLETLKTDIINNMQADGRFATGQTAEQIIVVDNGDHLQLQFPDYITALEFGREPTGKNAVAGNPPMIERIQQWCRDKGIDDKAVWAIKKSIDKKGYPGKPGILSHPLSDENISLRLDPILEEITASICDELIGKLD